MSRTGLVIRRECTSGIAPGGGTRRRVGTPEAEATMALMSHRPPGHWIIVVVGSVAVTALVAVGAATRGAPLAPAGDFHVIAARVASRPLSTGVLDPPSLGGSQGAIAYRKLRRTGARFVRMHVLWERVAPAGETRPTGFDARNPGDPRYRWAQTDNEVRLAVRNGFAPIVYVQTAPAWAENGRPLRANDGPVRPSPTALADFATALANRYSGAFGGLPRVRYWQVWNEPNLNIQLMPQFVDGKPASPEWYRAMVNAMAGAVHAVRRDNVVIAGGLAPFGGDSNDPSGGMVPEQERIRPLQFMRELLCMSAGAKPRATCAAKTEFDAWAHHPYTYGGPTHDAFHPDDVSLGDLGEMRSLLTAAAKSGHVRSRGGPAFWVTEFSYDSKPADPKGLAPELHARWVSEALYRMWKEGVSHVTWFLLRDEPFPDGMFQSGLYLRSSSGIAGDRPKLALRAFRFPFVAFWERSGSISYWGRTPAGVRKSVVVEQKAGGGWRSVAEPSVDRYGIFVGRIIDVRGSGTLRARLANGGDFSQPFSLEVTKDFRFCPWGSFC